MRAVTITRTGGPEVLEVVDVPGMDAAGTVDEVGDGVSWSIGR